MTCKMLSFTYISDSDLGSTEAKMYDNTYLMSMPGPVGAGQWTVSLRSLLHSSHGIWCVHLQVIGSSFLAILLLCMLEKLMQYFTVLNQKFAHMVATVDVGIFHARRHHLNAAQITEEAHHQ